MPTTDKANDALDQLFSEITRAHKIISDKEKGGGVIVNKNLIENYNSRLRTFIDQMYNGTVNLPPSPDWIKLNKNKDNLNKFLVAPFVTSETKTAIEQIKWRRVGEHLDKVITGFNLSKEYHAIHDKKRFVSFKHSKDVQINHLSNKIQEILKSRKDNSLDSLQNTITEIEKVIADKKIDVHGKKRSSLLPVLVRLETIVNKEKTRISELQKKELPKNRNG